MMGSVQTAALLAFVGLVAKLGTIAAAGRNLANTLLILMISFLYCHWNSSFVIGRNRAGERKTTIFKTNTSFSLFLALVAGNIMIYHTRVNKKWHKGTLTLNLFPAISIYGSKNL